MDLSGSSTETLLETILLWPANFPHRVKKKTNVWQLQEMLDMQIEIKRTLCIEIGYTHF
jgi:hypothetical protein